MGTPWVSFNGKDCSGCNHLNERGYCEFTGCVIPCTMRTTISDVKPQTNADRIRAMTDEELADFLDRWALGDIDYSKTFCSLCEGQFTCRECRLDWLRQEAEE